MVSRLATVTVNGQPRIIDPLAAVAAPVPLNGLWTTPLAGDHPLEDRPAYNGTADTTNNRGGSPHADRLARQARYHSGSTPVAGLYAQGYSTIVDRNAAPIYTIPTPDHPTQLVQWRVNNGTGADADLTANNGLQTHFQQVPVPVGPQGEWFETYYGRPPQHGAGDDRHLVIHNPFTHEVWEFWRFAWNATLGRYECGYGGYIPDVRECVALPNQWGARATSLPLAGGVMLRREYLMGSFRHPLALAVPVVLQAGFISPATREDGTLHANVVGGDTRDAIPEGAWFRLPAGYPVNPSKPKLWRMIVTAARDYGMVVVDGTGGTVTLAAESSRPIGTPYSVLGADPMPSGTEPTPYFGSANVLTTFPWEDLVQLKYAP